MSLLTGASCEMQRHCNTTGRYKFADDDVALKETVICSAEQFSLNVTEEHGQCNITEICKCVNLKF